MELFEYIDRQDTPYDIFCTSSVNSPLHWHYYSEILYIKSGRIKLICNDYSFILKQGDICYIYPLQLHEITRPDDGDLRETVDYAVIKFDIHTINIPEAYVRKMYDYFVSRNSDRDYCLIVHDAENISDSVLSAVSEYGSRDMLHTFKMQADIYGILIYIARMCSKTLPSKSNKRSDVPLSFGHILEYIDMHSSEKLDIADLAKKCHLSYSHFARLFKENYGRSCKEYITYIRLNKADELLMHTNYDVAYIAATTGFFDSSHFIKAYKEWKGRTPRQQRYLYTG